MAVFVCPHRNDYPLCLYPECSTSPEEKFDSRSSWSRISCGSELKVGFNPGSLRRGSFGVIHACFYSPLHREDREGTDGLHQKRGF